MYIVPSIQNADFLGFFKHIFQVNVTYAQKSSENFFVNCKISVPAMHMYTSMGTKCELVYLSLLLAALMFYRPYHLSLMEMGYIQITSNKGGFLQNRHPQDNFLSGYDQRYY